MPPKVCNWNQNWHTLSAPPKPSFWGQNSPDRTKTVTACGRRFGLLALLTPKLSDGQFVCLWQLIGLGAPTATNQPANGYGRSKSIVVPKILQRLIKIHFPLYYLIAWQWFVCCGCAGHDQPLNKSCILEHATHVQSTSGACLVSDCGQKVAFVCISDQNMHANYATLDHILLPKINRLLSIITIQVEWRLNLRTLLLFRA